MDFKKNNEGYDLFFKLEVLLREVIIEYFDIAFDSEDWCRRNGPLGIDINETCPSCNKSKNMSIPQKMENQRIDLIKKGWDYDSACSTHSIYFLLFTDLSYFFKQDKKRYKKGTEMIKVFSDLNDPKIDAIVAQIEQLYPIRNKIAHSSLINDRELGVLSSTVQYFESVFINPEKYYEIPVKRQSIMLILKSSIKNLTTEILQLNQNIEFYFEEYRENESYHKYLLNFNKQQFDSIIMEYISLNKKIGSYTNIKELVSKNKKFLIELL